jgi:tetratricopeptide (TPR) repeat protein
VTVGRNDPCPCGNGIKYKKCCGQIGAQAAAQAMHQTRAASVGTTATTGTIAQFQMDQLVGIFNRGNFPELEVQARALIGRYPNAGFVWKVLGLALKMQGKDALQAMKRSTELLPNDAEAHNNLGNAQRDLGQVNDAVTSFRQALKIQPSYAEAHNNLGNALKDLGDFDAAVASFRQALRIKPGVADIHWNLSAPLLAKGDYLEGWQHFEYRWKTGAMPPREFGRPLWLGQADLRGKSILLHAEQGFGDTLQFVRYATPLAALGATVYLEVPAPLKSLMASCEGVSAVFAQGEALPPFDYHCPLMSLPCAFKTELSTIPAAIPYLKSTPGKIADWREKLGKKEKAVLRVGLTWAGDPRKHLAAAQGVRAIDGQRSIHFDQLLPLLDLPGIEFVSLQVGDDARRQANGNPRLIDFTADLRDFEDTAALVENLDMAICVDTSVAHLVGAVGKPVWLLNRYNTCWRWLMGRVDSPWYPSMRIFRQPTLGDWTSVIAEVKRALAQVDASNPQTF